MSDLMFAEYGTISQIGTWCTEKEISMDYIEQLSLQALENFQDPDTCYLSTDLYGELMKSFAANYRYSGSSINGAIVAKVITSAGELRIKQVPGLTNFCFVGSETSFQRLEWEKISQEFEKALFGEEL